MCDSIDFWKKPSQVRYDWFILKYSKPNQLFSNEKIKSKQGWLRLIQMIGWMQVNLDLKSNLFLKLIESNLDLKF